jgi:hypothetical protein
MKMLKNKKYNRTRTTTKSCIKRFKHKKPTNNASGHHRAGGLIVEPRKGCQARRCRETYRRHVMMNAAWFVDREYLFKAWQGLGRQDKLDYLNRSSPD